ncbi:MAG: hypothetical protein GX608_10930 [Lentisphaerae bacterium]|nr:hypothetical protein [Lentisphaerota bacterium]
MNDRSGDEVARESGVQGRNWDGIHLGYFSDPDAAAVLVSAVMAAVKAGAPDMLVDLGGGTGFLLREAVRSGLDPRIRTVNMDISARQIEAVERGRIEAVPGAVDAFRRSDFAAGNERILFLMRSVLHYLGRDGLFRGLCHIRSQMRAGECFVHQTAVFADESAAACMSELYAGLGTGKWFPARAFLADSLGKAGFRIESAATAPALTLPSEELAARYGADAGRIEKIRAGIASRFGEVAGVFESRGPDRGFVSCLHYAVYTCIAF